MTWRYIRAPIYHEVASLKKVIKKYYRILFFYFYSWISWSPPAAILPIFMSILLNYNFMHIYLNTELQHHFKIISNNNNLLFEKNCYWFAWLNQANKVLSLTYVKFRQVQVSQLVNSKCVSWRPNTPQFCQQSRKLFLLTGGMQSGDNSLDNVFSINSSQLNQLKWM